MLAHLVGKIGAAILIVIGIGIGKMVDIAIHVVQGAVALNRRYGKEAIVRATKLGSLVYAIILAGQVITLWVVTYVSPMVDPG